MGTVKKLSNIFYYATHYSELRAVIQWNIWHQPVHERNEDSEPISLRRCFDLLDKTSRSFSAVIQELNPELLVPVCIFYLILRGLDTIEDDMTIALEEKEPLLRNFHNVVEEEGWTYNGNGPDEEDRDLLVKFNFVVTEFKKIKPAYKKIIKDIAKNMGNGMADYVSNTEHNTNGINTIDDYETYCHYVAGLVGQGLTRLFVESGLANRALLDRPELQESMGQFLQQTNIIRDIREDRDDKRRFWPKEVWSKYVDNFDDMFKPENREQALAASSEMVLLALTRADECLFYLAGIKDQSVFNFAAIPQSMAIATIELCFRNPAIFERNVKITKGQACNLMIRSSQNLQLVCGVFREFARKIHKKNTPKDPNFLRISIACGKIEQFIESIFPLQKPDAIITNAGLNELTPAEKEKQKEDAEEAKWDVIYLGGFVALILFFTSAIMIAFAWYFGARFDVAGLADGWRDFWRIMWPSSQTTANITSKLEHGEL